MMDLKFDLTDVTIMPCAVSNISSRSEININVIFRDEYQNKLPLITAPMDTVISTDNFENYLNCGIIPCLPRNSKHNDKLNKHLDEVFMSFGLNQIETDLKHLGNGTGLDFNKYPFYHYKNILIDIANGHMQRLIDIVKKIKKLFPDIKIMVGNIANPLTFKNLAMAGADYVRVGIGGGAGCFVFGTQVQTFNGIKNIEDIVIGDKVLTHRGTYEEVFNTIQYDTTEELIKINDTISTKNHEYYVLHKKYIDIINDQNIHKYAEFISADKLSEDYLLIQADV